MTNINISVFLVVIDIERSLYFYYHYRRGKHQVLDRKHFFIPLETAS